LPDADVLAGFVPHLDAHAVGIGIGAEMRSLPTSLASGWRSQSPRVFRLGLTTVGKLPSMTICSGTGMMCFSPKAQGLGTSR
jgi:hypothetical protein